MKNIKENLIKVLLLYMLQRSFFINYKNSNNRKIGMVKKKVQPKIIPGSEQSRRGKSHRDGANFPFKKMPDVAPREMRFESG